MAEPCSFYMKITIKNDDFQRLMKAEPTQPSLNDNWRLWWDSRRMYGKTELTNNELRAYNNASNQDLIDGWLKAEGAYAYSEYNEKSETWNFGIIEFGENYLEIIPQLAFALSIIEYKTFSPDDFAIVYPYFWGDSGVMAYIRYEQDRAILLPDIHELNQVPETHVGVASDFLGKKWQEFESTRERD